MADDADDRAGTSSGRRASVTERVLDLAIQRLDVIAGIATAIGAERDAVAIQTRILLGAKDLTNADGGTIYSVDRERGFCTFAVLCSDSLGLALGGPGEPNPELPPVPLRLPDGRPNVTSVVAHAVLTGGTTNLADAYDAKGFDFSGTKAFDRRTGYRSKSMLTIPMRDHEGEIVGVLQLLNARAGDNRVVIPFSSLAQRLAESLASQAAIALTRIRLIADLERTLAAFIEVLADAIDQKSPHTGGHCRRVTELSMLVAEACHSSARGALAAFRMEDADRRELYLAALLHDVGKITTPEWVMEKATKLQGLHDRIAEVAARIEIFRRDARIRALEAIAGGADRAACEAALADELRALDEDLVFLRRVNRGVEAMSPEDQERVRRLGQRRWVDAAGDERTLLQADEVEHLCVARGTLTQAERAIIEHHIVATQQMLARMPFPKHLARIPEYAGGHHERVDGKGYPNGLTREQMSIPARAMAVADVFEALTAADRPYKKPMPLSQAFRILAGMARDGHLDRDIVIAFLESDGWRRYAMDRLRPEQRDCDDVEALVDDLDVGRESRR